MNLFSVAVLGAELSSGLWNYVENLLVWPDQVGNCENFQNLSEKESLV